MAKFHGINDVVSCTTMFHHYDIERFVYTWRDDGDLRPFVGGGEKENRCLLIPYTIKFGFFYHILYGGIQPYRI